MSSPQLTLDRLIAQHVTQYKHQEKTSQDTTFVDISVSSAEATLVLATPPIKELAVRENFAQPRYMLVNGYLGGIHSRVVVTHGSYGSSIGEIVASFQTARFVVHPMISNLRRPISPPPCFSAWPLSSLSSEIPRKADLAQGLPRGVSPLW